MGKTTARALNSRTHLMDRPAEHLMQDRRASSTTSIESSILDKNKLGYPLRLLSLYRAFIALLLATLYYTDLGDNSLGDFAPALFNTSSTIYLLLSAFWIMAARLGRPSYEMQIYLQFLSDIILITLLMHASGGLDSGLGILLIVIIGASSLMLKGLVSMLFPAIASIAILTEQVYSQFVLQIVTTNTYPQAGALGAALFGTAALIMILNRRIQETEELATRRGLDLRNMAQLNEYVIQHIQSGVIIIDNDKIIRLMNHAATDQLNSQHIEIPAPLARISNELNLRHDLWLENKKIKSTRIQDPNNSTELQPHFTELGHHGNSGTLILLEDTSFYTRELQSIKLASLGRLTASIAHEIRNPLSAIQHASQLLNESPDAKEYDKRLIDIIGKQSSRMNTIIKNIMQLSSHEKIKPAEIQLLIWLETFKQDFCAHHNVEPEFVTIDINPDETLVYIDSSYLHQIVWNLCSNSLKYGRSQDANLRLHFSGGYDKNSGAAWLNIADQGKGIDIAVQDRIFEPFYTSSSSSTGLGLYIVRELCAFNHADIRCLPTKMGCCFRISFADPVQLGI